MASNEDQIRSVVQRFSEAWNRNNGAEVGAFFTEDGCLINPFGERANGRASVGEMYTRYLGEYSKVRRPRSAWAPFGWWSRVTPSSTATRLFMQPMDPCCYRCTSPR